MSCIRSFVLCRRQMIIEKNGITSSFMDRMNLRKMRRPQRVYFDFILCLYLFQALDMIHGIRAAFGELLEEAEWMDDPTRKVAKEKVSFKDCIICASCKRLRMFE